MRGLWRVVICAFVLASFAVGARAQVPEHPDGRVHDWLVWWPRCAQDAFVPERLATSQLLYPRPGFPAVVRAVSR